MVAVIAAGAALRLSQYLFNYSLIWDESAMALAIFDWSPAAAGTPLSNNQASPLGFVMAEWALVRALGESELALRLLPALLYVASVAVFWWATRSRRRRRCWP
jgi:hypothetical protein